MVAVKIKVTKGGKKNLDFGMYMFSMNWGKGGASYILPNTKNMY